MGGLQRSTSTSRFLNILPGGVRDRIAARCRRVALERDIELCASGAPIRQVYFPLAGGYVSLLMPIQGKTFLEVGLIGDEGMFGVSLALGVGFSPQQALVQGKGEAMRIGAAAFRSLLSDNPELQRLAGRYAHVQMSRFA